MDITELISNTRTCRRFHENRRLALSRIQDLLNAARLSGSARNCQPWQYMIITDERVCEKVFPYLGWAGYLSDWKGPAKGEQPAAYILCLLNHNWLKGSEREAWFDLGISSQNLLLAATQDNLLGCRIGAFSPHLREQFTMPEHLSLELVIALGEPAEKIIVEPLSKPDDIKYWRDEQQIHHVPKRSLDDILIELQYEGTNG